MAMRIGRFSNNPGAGVAKTRRFRNNGVPPTPSEQRARPEDLRKILRVCMLSLDKYRSTKHHEATRKVLDLHLIFFVLRGPSWTCFLSALKLRRSYDES